MVSKLLGAGIASMAAIGLLAVSLLMRFDAQQTTPVGRAYTALARDLNRATDRSDAPLDGWAVTKAVSAQRAMVVDVDAGRLGRAREIAVRIVEAVRARGFDEILIYVRQPGTAEPTVRRVQWTPNGGYVDATYADR
jgi:hypothetical protein